MMRRYVLMGAALFALSFLAGYLGMEVYCWG